MRGRKVIGWLYRNGLKHILFLRDPEKVHDDFLAIGELLGKCKATRKLTKFFFAYNNQILEQKIKGVTFPNPVGLAAGFDKDARLTNILPCVGFGHAELGSITGEPCNGNPGRHLWRLKKEKSLLVYYGLKNKGCKAISEMLKDKTFKIPFGFSIAKTNNEKTVDFNCGLTDYLKALKTMEPFGAYLTINISCPNAHGGEQFTKPELLDKLLIEVDKLKIKKPVFLKITPELSEKQIDQILIVCNKHKVEGFIFSNLKKNFEKVESQYKSILTKGGLSGHFVTKDSLRLLKHVYTKTKGKYILMGCGGISNAKIAYEMIKNGASLLQLITAMIYEGPQVVAKINEGLVELLKKDGFSKISEAVGSNLR